MKPSIETIAIIGAGALGAVYGSILYEMNPDSVCFIAGGTRYDRLKRDGVVVSGTRYGIAVARPGEATPADLLIVVVKLLQTLSPEGKTSMLQDVEVGRTTEVEMLAGTLIELGKRHGIPTPVNRKLFNELKRIEASVGK